MDFFSTIQTNTVPKNLSSASKYFADSCQAVAQAAGCRLLKITGWAKSCLKPSTGPVLAWLFLAWPGLASSVLRSGYPVAVTVL